MSKTESKVQMQGKNLGDTMNAATRIAMNANSILQQPDIKLDELKNLPEHQKSTRAHYIIMIGSRTPGLQSSVLQLTSSIMLIPFKVHMSPSLALSIN